MSFTVRYHKAMEQSGPHLASFVQGLLGAGGLNWSRGWMISGFCFVIAKEWKTSAARVKHPRKQRNNNVNEDYLFQLYTSGTLKFNFCYVIHFFPLVLIGIIIFQYQLLPFHKRGGGKMNVEMQDIRISSPLGVINLLTVRWALRWTKRFQIKYSVWPIDRT